MRLLPYCLTALLTLALPATGHEFWISPEDYTVGPSDQLIANIRVGQNFKGNANSFFPNSIVRFDLVFQGQAEAVDGRMGDKPALNLPAPAEGLITIVHQTADSSLKYSEFQKFVKFATHKDFTEVLEEHKARGLPEAGFRESYSRFAKSLVAVGHGAGSDSDMGLLTEIVALSNPYIEDVSAGLPVLVLYEGAARKDTQVELFDKAPDGEVTISILRTNSEGIALLPVNSGHEYLVDAVVMRALEPVGENDPVWESLWASLTFKIPATE